MTRIAWFHGRLLTDAVLPVRSATVGAQKGLDHIPGSCFLGAASRLYDELGNDAFLAFHSGRVRFRNAYPRAASGRPTLPAPYSWHHEKGAKLHDRASDTLVAANLHDLVRTPPKPGSATVYKQVRDGFFNASGEMVRHAPGFRLKTAIDATTGGRSRENMLFGYRSLPADSTWWTAVEADDDVDEDLFQRLIQTLEGTISVGRSRSAEFGRLELWRTEEQWSPDCRPPEIAGLCVVYLASDLALLDPSTGMPTLVPTASSLGLAPDWYYAAESSYVRSRRYAPFNGKRRGPDVERQVLGARSVLTFRWREDAGEPPAPPTGEASVGFDRQVGLGHILWNPAFVTCAPAEALSEARPRADAPRAPTAPDGELFQWLAAKEQDLDRGRRLRELAARQAERLLVGMREENHDGSLSGWPGSSQWKKLADIAGTLFDQRDAREGAGVALTKALFEPAASDKSSKARSEAGLLQHGISAAAWSRPLYLALPDEAGRKALREHLKAILTDAGAADSCELLMLLVDYIAPSFQGRQAPEMSR